MPKTNKRCPTWNNYEFDWPYQIIIHKKSLNDCADLSYKFCVEIWIINRERKLLLLKGVSSARLRESDLHLISPKTPAHETNLYTERRKIKISRRLKEIEQLRPINKHCPCSWNPTVPYRQIQGEQNRYTETERGLRFCGTARFCSEEAHEYTDERPEHRSYPALTQTA